MPKGIQFDKVVLESIRNIHIHEEFYNSTDSFYIIALETNKEIL